MEIEDVFKGDRNASAAISLSAAKRYPSLVTIALEPARVLRRLWQRPRDGREPMLRGMVFMSGTLSVPGERRAFADFCRRLGIDSRWSNIAGWRSKVYDHDSFGSCTFVLADRKIPTPWLPAEPGEEPKRNPVWVDYARYGIAEARRRGGRVLVLTASYDDAVVLSEGVDDAIVHRRGQPLPRVLDRFTAAEDTILFSPCAWVGVDLPYMIDHVVIPRLPFSAPDEVREKVIETHRRAKGQSTETIGFELMAQSRANAKRRILQGQGRGIRKADDGCVVWILDPRFPIPETMRGNPRLRLSQGHASSYGDFVRTIPARFSGPFGSFRQAEILRLPDPNGAAPR